MQFKYLRNPLILILFSILYFGILLINPLGQPKKELNENPKEISIFCMILTTPKGFKTEKSQVVFNIWASKCDNTKFVTLIPPFKDINQNITFNEKHILMKPNGYDKDDYWNLTRKVLFSFKQIYQEYPNYDWYLKADDDTYIQIDNLRSFLKNKNPQKPVTYGHDFKVIVENGYHSGGAGYLLSKEALKRLGSAMVNNSNFCEFGPYEDVFVAKCLRKLGVFPNKSIDEHNRERFLPLPILSSYTGKVPDWFLGYVANPYRKGIDCCSDSFISFHYMSPQMMIRLDSVIKRLTHLQKIHQKYSDRKIIKPTFKQIVENYINYEKLSESMRNF